jgi:SPP1 family predicted phage head-tail adaptor
MLQAPGNIDPGRLDRRVTLAQPVTTRDAVGGAIVSWLDAATVWAERRPVRQARQFAAEGKQYLAELTYRLRHRDDVAGGWRLVDGTKVFEVVDLLPLGREHLLELGVRGLNDTATETMADFIASLVGYRASTNSSGTTTLTPTLTTTDTATIYCKKPSI